MNKVAFLQQNKFTQFCVEDQLKIKALGRDLPDLNLAQNTSEKMGRLRKFNSSLYLKSNWICGCDVTHRLYCFPCVLYGGDEHWAEKGVDDLNHVWEKIKTHEKNARHMHNIFSLTMLGKVDVKIMLNSSLRSELLKQNEMVRQNRHALDKIINGIRSCAAFDLALRGQRVDLTAQTSSDFVQQIDFMEEILKDTKESIEKFPFFKGTSKNVVEQLVECCYGVAREEIIKQVRETEHVALIFDEAYEMGYKCQLTIIVRYLCHKKPVERFWNIIYPEAVDAESIADALMKEIEPLVQNCPEKLVSLSYDGCSVASGSLTIMFAKFKEKHPQVSFVHYYGHPVNLIISSAASQNKQAKIFFSSLCSLCSFLSSTRQAITMLNEIVKNQKVSWNFDALDQAITTIQTYRKELVLVMDLLEKNANDSTVNQAGGYKFRLQDKQFIFWLGIFNKIIPLVVTYFNSIQKEGVDPLRKTEDLKKFENAMFNQQQNIDVTISEIENEVNAPVGLNDDDDEEQVAKKPRLLNHEKRREEAMAIYNAISRHVNVRFNSIRYLYAINLFKISSFKEYRMTFPTRYLENTLKEYNFLEKAKINSELQVVYERPELRVMSGLVPLLNLVADKDLGSTFQEIIKLLSVLCTMPVETAETERCFPILNQLKSFYRNSARTSNLNALTMLVIEKSFVNDIDDYNHKVINLFATRKQRLEFVFRKV